MKSVTYYDEYTDCEITVEEMTRAEGIEYAIDFIEGMENYNGHSDMSVYVEYNDGTYYHNIDGDVSGRKFKKTGIKAIILDDGYEYYVFGKYTMSDNTIPEVA